MPSMLGSLPPATITKPCKSSLRCHVAHSRAHPVTRRTPIVAHGTAGSTAPSRPRPGQKKGFVEEMRMVAMRLHTREQSPKEGQQEASKQKWEPTREGYLQFLADSKTLFTTLEDIVNEAPHPDYARFRNTGLERSQALTKDLQWFKTQYGLEPKPLTDDSPGCVYSQVLQRLAKDDPPAFICHFYNIYFAHSAGGRMIGKSISNMLLDKAELEFYKYDGDLKQYLDQVKDILNEVAQNWTDEEKKHCLEETTESFKYSGAVMRSISSNMA